MKKHLDNFGIDIDRQNLKKQINGFISEVEIKQKQQELEKFWANYLSAIKEAAQQIAKKYPNSKELKAKVEANREEFKQKVEKALLQIIKSL